MNKIEIEIPDGYFFDKETMSIKKLPEPQFVYVDLGLPSGTKWATCNVEAKKDTEYGDYLNFESAQKYNCPSKEQIYELEENTTSLWITKESVNGMLFIGKNGNHIFIPAAGYHHGESLEFDASRGYYWSSTPFTVYDNYANDLYFDSNFVSPCYVNKCFLRLPVRPVYK